MSKVYDPLDNGLAQLNKDLEKLMNDLIWANQVAIASLEQPIVNKIKEYADLNETLDNWYAVSQNNESKFIRNKYAPTMRTKNTTEQATYAEYGYGIIGMRYPLLVTQQIFGDVGWQGYDLPSRYKRPDHSWWYSRQGIIHHTYGERSVPTYYRTFKYYEQNLANIIATKLQLVMNKL